LFCDAREQPQSSTFLDAEFRNGLHLNKAESTIFCSQDLNTTRSPQ